MKLDDHTYVLSLTVEFGGTDARLNPTLIVDEAGGHTLVDTGLPGQEEAIGEAMAEAGVRAPDLARIVLTHQDPDHVGSLHALVRQSGARVLAHPEDAPYIEGQLPPIKLSPEALKQRPQMRAILERLTPVPVDERIEDGAHLETAGGVRVVFTPGHTPGHISLYLERQRTLIAGDALTADAGRLGGPSPQVTLDMAEAWRSVGRLALELGIIAARDTFLRRIKAEPLPEVGKIRVLGVDDFSFKKGSTYGTILVDLECHKVVDLLPERSQESLVAWFESHPGAAEVEVATRDRSNIYREGLAKGAPGATHVADRWHLLRNLALTLEEYLLQKRPILQKAVAPEAASEEKDATDFASGPIMPNRPRTHDAKIEEAARKRHERLVEQWRNIRLLYLAKADLRDICRQLGISARTVYRYKDLTEPPPRPAYKRKASVLDPYVPYLVARWNEGCHNGKRLYREIREQGYANSEEICARFTAQLRRAEARGKQPSSVPRARQGSVAGLSPTAKNVAALFMRHEEKLDEEQEKYLKRLCEADEALADTHRLTQEFAEMVRRLEGEDLDGWLKDAEASNSTAMRSFAAGLRKDLDAVRAGLTEEWSNGPVEGFVHKLKLLKRQGYGRAGFEMLRARMLAA